jgi:RimJ/RimL family protein N-acetyltransferase
MTILETTRLRLRQVKESDAEFLVELLNEPAFIRFVADRGVRTRADALKYIADKIEPSYAEFGFGFYIVELRENGTAVGMCGLIKRETLDDVDIGFSVLERFRGRGYAFEAAAAVMQYGRDELRLPRVIGLSAPDNQSSIRLLQKLGLRYEETIQLPGYESESRIYR